MGETVTIAFAPVTAGFRAPMDLGSPASTSSQSSRVKSWVVAQSGLCTVALGHERAASRAEGLFSRQNMLTAAGRRLASCAEHGISSNVIETTFAVVCHLLEDDFPTPQIAADGEGGIETEWLVDGRSLVLNCLGDGSSFIWAADDDGSVSFSGVFNVKWMEGDATLDLAKTCLTQMSLGVSNRVLSAR